jgi:hypothetical protein
VTCIVRSGVLCSFPLLQFNCPALKNPWRKKQGCSNNSSLIPRHHLHIIEMMSCASLNGTRQYHSADMCVALTFRLYTYRAACAAADCFPHFLHQRALKSKEPGVSRLIMELSHPSIEQFDAAAKYISPTCTLCLASI